MQRLELRPRGATMREARERGRIRAAEGRLPLLVRLPLLAILLRIAAVGASGAVARTPRWRRGSSPGRSWLMGSAGARISATGESISPASAAECWLEGLAGGSAWPWGCVPSDKIAGGGACRWHREPDGHAHPLLLRSSVASAMRPTHATCSLTHAPRPLPRSQNQPMQASSWPIRPPHLRSPPHSSIWSGRLRRATTPPSPIVSTALSLTAHRKTLC